MYVKDALAVFGSPPIPVLSVCSLNHNYNVKSTATFIKIFWEMLMRYLAFQIGQIRTFWEKNALIHGWTDLLNVMICDVPLLLIAILPDWIKAILM